MSVSVFSRISSSESWGGFWNKEETKGRVSAASLMDVKAERLPDNYPGGTLKQQ